MALGEDIGLSITPHDVMEQVQRGRDRMRRFRNARLLFIKNYIGQYYDADHGEIGVNPLNLIFNAIRVIIPYIVTNFPTFSVSTQFMAYRDYAELLSLSLDQHSKQIDVASVYRQVIVDAIFGSIGILKTGLAQSDSIYALNDTDHIDSGEIYTEHVDFDCFIPDPTSREYLFKDARFLGDVMTVPRRKLLESGLYKNDLVERLPRFGAEEREDRAHQLSMREIDEDDAFGLEDEVEVAELWVPGANAIVTVPASKGVTFDDYLRVDDYYGVKEGPLTFLSLTSPVPGNPLPVQWVGIWNDLHVLSNRMAKKVIEQALRQKDVMGYRRQAADDAEEVKEAGDGDMVAMDDPQGVEIHSFGGQRQSNEAMLAQLMGWFNLMSGDPEQLSGSAMNSGSATETRVRASNTAIGLEDMKDAVYKMSATEGRKRAFYKFSDPLVQEPLIRRRVQPAQFAPGMAGPMMMAPAQMIEEQVVLSPEARRGEFLDYAFTIMPESMGRKDSQTRFAQALDFIVKALPSIASTAQAMVAIGMPFNPRDTIIEMARMAGIDWMDRAFYDPEFQMMMMQRMMMGPQPGEAKGQLSTAPAGGMGSAMMAGGNLMGQMMQNGQPSNVGAGQPGMMEQIMADFQSGANDGQSMLKRGIL